MNIAQLQEEAYKRLGNRRIVVFEDEEVTSKTCLESARKLHRGLEKLGLGQGKVANLFMANHPLAFSIFPAIFRTGAAAVPIMFMWPEKEFRYVLKDCRSSGIITDRANLEKSRKAAEGLDHIEWIIVVGGDDNLDSKPPEFSIDSLLNEKPKLEVSQIDENETALMIYTTGTTGKPKGVELTHRNLIAATEASIQAFGMNTKTKPQIKISAFPIAHMSGLISTIWSFMLPDHLAESYDVQLSFFKPDRFMELVQRHKAQLFSSVPTMLALILSHPKVNDYDLSSIEDVLTGGAPVPPELVKAFGTKYNCSVREGYGLSESCGIGTIQPYGGKFKPGSAGKPYDLPGHVVKIFDDEGYELPSGVSGEVVIKGPCVMKGYHNDPVMTKAVMTKGFLRTGDIGYFDEEGYLFIVDRKKDMIIRGGENLYPAEIEGIMYGMDDIAEACVVGVPDTVYGERVEAFVYLKPNSLATEKDIINYMKTHTNTYKVPEKVYISSEPLPKIGVGKILRRELRERAKK